MLEGLFETATDVDRDRDMLKYRAYGIIEVCDQELRQIRFRPYPNLVSLVEVHWANLWKKRSRVSSRADRVLLYYNQPIMHRNFLSLSYFVSDHKSSIASIAVCLSVLDFIAKVKQTDAIVTEITNNRIKDRHLEHFGWERHLLTSKKRHWIKRFYGEYPESFLFQEIGGSHDVGKKDAPAVAKEEELVAAS